MLNNLNYEIIGREEIEGNQYTNCIVLDQNGIVFDKFQLIKDENNNYLALTFDTRFKVNLRKAIENDLNSKLSA